MIRTLLPYTVAVLLASMVIGIIILGRLTGDGPTVFDHVCRMGLEGIVSKRTDAPYRSRVKSKNPASEAVRREREEEWR